jgi:pilus assembly protein Flp/PilA
MQMQRLVQRLLADESGASAIEYGLVASLISVTIIVALTMLGVNLAAMAMEVVEAIGEIVG